MVGPPGRASERRDLRKPMGSALSGLISLSKERIISSKRHQLKGDEKYPRRIFFLKRCMMVNKYQIGKQELTLINIHLSPYDKGGLIRKKQIDHLIEFINDYSKENKHVIIGGDWNHLLDSDLYKSTMPEWVGLLPENLFKTSYRMIYDNSVNTVRSEDKPYIKGKNFEIDCSSCQSPFGANLSKSSLCFNKSSFNQ